MVTVSIEEEEDEMTIPDNPSRYTCRGMLKASGAVTFGAALDAQRFEFVDRYSPSSDRPPIMG